MMDPTVGPGLFSSVCCWARDVGPMTGGNVWSARGWGLADVSFSCIVLRSTQTSGSIYRAVNVRLNDS